MIDDHVTLYFQKYSFVVLKQSFLTYNLDPSIVTTMSIPKVNEMPTYDITWINSALGAEYLIY
jgi:hypothetical protein